MTLFPEDIDRNFTYLGDDLGAVYTKASSKVKVWSPHASAISILIQTEPLAKHIYSMKQAAHGVFEITLEGDYEAAYYRFIVVSEGQTTETTDPYAKASTANGAWSIIVDPQKFVPIVYKGPRLKSPTDAIIYETSIRDFTSDVSLSAKHPKTYRGFIEENLKTPHGRNAGFDYLKTLGVTHVQLMPIFDFEGIDETDADKTYNWGYNPSQYFVPEGSYSSDPDHPYARINEVRTMVDTLHKHHIGVVMDVVFNHIYDVLTYPLGILSPGYPYRKDSEGKLSETSGCKSDLATERSMVRKLIIDCASYWLKTFNLDGFRFDLMGLIDLDTMHELEATLRAIRPDLLLYGEGWKMPTVIDEKALAHMYNPKLSPTIGFFNDDFRDTLKGSIFNVTAKGYALGSNENLSHVSNVLLGSKQAPFPIKNPPQSINYVSCHDNHTLYDKIDCAMPDEPEEYRLKYQNLATLMTVFAIGVPFIHSGQEFYRSKHKIANSFRSPDAINRLDWTLIDRHHAAIETFRKALFLRKTEPLLRLCTYETIAKHTNYEALDTGTIIITLKDDGTTLKLIYKNSKEEESLTFTSLFDTLLSAGETHQSNNTLTLFGVSAVIIKMHHLEENHD